MAFSGCVLTIVSFSTSALSVGTHRISFQVEDNDNLWSTPDIRTLIINPPTPNVAPTATVDSVAPNPAPFGQSVSFVGHGNDSDGNIVSYNWTSSIDGFLSSSRSFSTSALSVGTHRISFQVEDNDNLWSTPDIRTLIINPPTPNVAPTATVDSVAPNPAPFGQSVSFVGHGNDSDGNIVSYNWTSSIDGFLSSSRSFSTSALSVGTHTIYFQVEARESNSNLVWSEATTQTLTINGNRTPLFLVLVAILIIALIGIAYYLTYLVRPSLKKIEKDSLKRHTQEAKKEAEEEKEKERDKKEKKAFLKLEIKVPPRVWESESAMAEGKVLNEGVAAAEDVQISAAATPGLILDKSGMKFSELQPLEEKSVVFPFVASNQIKRGNYKLRFEIKSKQTSSRVKDRSLRAIKIGLLSDSGGQKNADLLKGWFKEHSFTWDELTGADNFLKLLEFDLIVVAYESDLPPKWVKNISNFVDQSQSLLVIDKIKTTSMELISQTLGYSSMTFEDFDSVERSLVISDNQHEATRTLRVGDKIPFNGRCSSICTSSVDKGQILANQIINKKTEEGPSKTFPAIVANNYGEGRVIYLNFCLEQSVLEHNEILLSFFNWLISPKHIRETE